MRSFDRQTNLRHILDLRASAAMEGVDLMPEISERTRQTRSLRRLVPTNRLTWIAAAGLAAFFVVGAVYMGISVVEELFGFEWSQTVNEGLVQEIELTRTVGDVTVKLERGYADPNFVILGMTISGPKERYAFGEPTGGGERVPLLTSNGIDMPQSSGMSTDRWGSVSGDWQPTQRLAEIAAYDASEVRSKSGELVLQVETYVVDQADTVVGPFIFEFVLPVVPGKLVKVAKTAKISGHQVTLDRVVITPSATRAFIEFPPTGLPLLTVSGISVSVELPSGKTATESFSQSVFNDDGSTLESFIWNATEDLTNEHGVWELKVILNDNTQEPAVFTFEVP